MAGGGRGDLRALSDEELLILCRDAPASAAGGEEIRRAIGVLAERHHAALIRYLATMVGRAEAAEDLAQEAFVRLYRHAREYREGAAKVTTWLYRIATNLALNEIRDRRKRPRISLDAPYGGGGDGAGPRAGDADGSRSLGSDVADRRAESSPTRQAEARNVRDRVRQAVDELPELYRAVILLCDLEGLRYDEAADALGVPIGTVRSRLFRARERFQEKLGPAFARGDLV